MSTASAEDHRTIDVTQDRQNDRDRRVEWLVAVLVFAATALVYTAPGLLPGRGMGGFDIWAFTTPFRETTPAQLPINNPLQTDQLEQLPLVSEFWSSARDGDLQLWEPDQAAGVPLLTAVYNRVLAPSNLVYAFVPPHKAAGVAIALALFLAQLGTWVLARRLGVGVWGSLLAGVAYGFSGPVTALLLRIHETSMLPWVLVGIHACFARERGRTGILVTAVATAGTLLSGFPAAALHVLYLAGAFGLWLAVDLRRRAGAAAAVTGLARAAVGGATGGLLTAPVLLPTAEWLTSTGSIERSFVVTHALGLDRLATAVSGRFFGAPQDGDFALGEQGLANAVEASMTMGVIVLLLLAYLAWRPPSRGDVDRAISRFLVPAGMVVLVAVVLGGPVLGLIHQLPYMSSNAFGRARFIVSLVVALLAGIGLDTALARRAAGAPVEDGDRWVRWSALAVVASVGLGCYLALAQAVVDDRLAAVAKDLGFPFVSGMAAVLALAVLWRRPTVPVWGVSGVVVLALAIELQAGAWGFVSTAPEDQFYPRPDLPVQMAMDIGPGGGHRFVATSLNPLPPNAAALLDLTDLRVSFPAYEPWRELVEVADPGVFDRRRLRTIFTEAVDWNSPALDRLATRYLVHPLRDPLLEVAEEEQQSPVSELRWAAPALQAPIRAVALGLDRGDCTSGWVELFVDGQRVSRRLAREVRGEVVFPVPDLIGVGGASFEVSLTDCSVVSASPTARWFTAQGPLTVISTDGLVVYERSNARPRADLAETVQVVAEGQVLEAVGRLPATTAVTVVDPEVAAGAQGTVTLTLDDPDRVVLTSWTDGAALVVLRDVAAPGWHATIDDEPVPTIAVDHALRGVTVPGGEHEIVFRYWPRTLTVGLWLAAAALAVLALSTRWSGPRI